MRCIPRTIAAACTAALAFCLGSGALHAAESFPTRPITIIVPFPPGGSTDKAARMIAKRLQENVGQPVVIDNKGGGNGIIGIQALKQAAPDGYTLFVGHAATHAINPGLYSNLPYDPIKDFTPITPFMSFPSVLVVPAGHPDKSVADLVRRARENPGALTYSSQGTGTAGHLLGAMLETSTGTRMIHIPMKGAAPAVAEVVAGRVDMVFSSYITAGGFVKDGRLRMLAMASSKRSEALPDLPTMAELGFPNVELDYWFGIFGPAGMPPQLVQRLNQELVKAVRSPAVADSLTSQAADVVTSSPAEFAALIEADARRLGKLVRDTGMKAD